MIFKMLISAAIQDLNIVKKKRQSHPFELVE